MAILMQAVPDDEEVNGDSLKNIRPLHLDCHILSCLQLALVHLQRQDQIAKQSLQVLKRLQSVWNI